VKEVRKIIEDAYLAQAESFGIITLNRAALFKSHLKGVGASR